MEKTPTRRGRRSTTGGPPKLDPKPDPEPEESPAVRHGSARRQSARHSSGKEAGESTPGRGRGKEAGESTPGRGRGKEAGEGTPGRGRGKEAGEGTPGRGRGKEAGEGTPGRGRGKEGGEGTPGRGRGRGREITPGRGKGKEVGQEEGTPGQGGVTTGRGQRSGGEVSPGRGKFTPGRGRGRGKAGVAGCNTPPAVEDQPRGRGRGKNSELSLDVVEQPRGRGRGRGRGGDIEAVTPGTSLTPGRSQRSVTRARPGRGRVSATTASPGTDDDQSISPEQEETASRTTRKSEQEETGSRTTRKPGQGETGSRTTRKPGQGETGSRTTRKYEQEETGTRTTRKSNRGTTDPDVETPRAKRARTSDNPTPKSAVKSTPKTANCAEDTPKKSTPDAANSPKVTKATANESKANNHEESHVKTEVFSKTKGKTSRAASGKKKMEDSPKDEAKNDISKSKASKSATGKSEDVSKESESQTTPRTGRRKVREESRTEADDNVTTDAKKSGPDKVTSRGKKGQPDTSSPASRPTRGKRVSAPQSSTPLRNPKGRSGENEATVPELLSPVVPNVSKRQKTTKLSPLRSEVVSDVTTSTGVKRGSRRKSGAEPNASLQSPDNGTDPEPQDGTNKPQKASPKSDVKVKSKPAKDKAPESKEDKSLEAVTDDEVNGSQREEDKERIMRAINLTPIGKKSTPAPRRGRPRKPGPDLSEVIDSLLDSDPLNSSQDSTITTASRERRRKRPAAETEDGATSPDAVPSKRPSRSRRSVQRPGTPDYTPGEQGEEESGSEREEVEDDSDQDASFVGKVTPRGRGGGGRGRGRGGRGRGGRGRGSLSKKIRGRGRPRNDEEEEEEEEDLPFEGPVDCVHCKETFQAEDDIKNHMLMKHHRIWTMRKQEGELNERYVFKLVGHIKCLKCDKQFNFFHYFRFHGNWCGREEELATCDKCGHVVKAMWLKEHLRTTHGEGARKPKPPPPGTGPPGEGEGEEEGEAATSGGRRQRKAASKARKSFIAADDGEEKGGDKDGSDFQPSDADDPDVKLDDVSSSDDDDDDVDEGEDLSEEMRAAAKEQKRLRKLMQKQRERRTGKKYVGVKARPKRRADVLEDKFSDTFSWYRDHAARGALFPAWLPKPADWVPLDQSSANEYLPENKQSVDYILTNAKVTDKTLGLSPDLTSQSMSLPLFGSESLKDEATCCVGGPIWSLAWLPDWRSSISEPAPDQYLAVYCHREAGQLTLMDCPLPGPSLLQIWNCGPLAGDTPPSPNLALALALDSGAVWDMKWCPIGGHDPRSEVTDLPRLGLLACACEDGQVKIYSIPDPKYLKQEVGTKVYKISPAVCLSQFPSNTEANYGSAPSGDISQSQISLQDTSSFVHCMCLDWSWQDGCAIIVAGFSNGTVSMWDLTTTSPLLLTHSEGISLSGQPYQVSHLWPYSTLQCHLRAVKGIAFYQASGHIIATTSEDRQTKYWDLSSSTTAPLHSTSRSAGTALAWPLQARGPYLGYDDCFQLEHNAVSYGDVIHPGNRMRPTIRSNDCIQDVDYSNWLHTIACCDQAGMTVGMTMIEEDRFSHDKGFGNNRFLVEVTTVEPEGDTSQNDVTDTDTSNTTSTGNKRHAFYRGNLDTLPSLKLIAKDLPYTDLRANNVPTGTHKVKWNPNLSSHLWLAYGGWNGLLRLRSVSALRKHTEPVLRKMRRKLENDR